MSVDGQGTWCYRNVAESLNRLSRSISSATFTGSSKLMAGDNSMDLLCSLSKPDLQFPSKKAITWVHSSRNVDITRISNGHISVLLLDGVTRLGKLLVLHMLCMSVWSWPNPALRSRSRGFWNSDTWLQTSRNIDITRISEGRKSVLLQARVTWSGILVVL